MTGGAHNENSIRPSIMVTKVQQWGNSLGVRIPRAFAEEVRVSAGSTVEISLREVVSWFDP